MGVVRFRRRQRWRRSLAVLPLVLIGALSGAIGVVGYFRFSPDAPFHLSNFPTIPSSPVGAQTITGVASVIDGDTIEIHGTRIRLFGIDAPENGQSCTVQGKAFRCGQAAAFALSNKIGSQVVDCHPKDTDRYGRTVAVCLVGGEDINGWMVAQGWALAYRYYSADYVSQEERASKERIGIWQGEFEPSWNWRRDHSEQTNSRRSGNRASSPSPRAAEPQQVMYFRPGEFSGTRYPTLHDCERARERAGNVGVCVMK